MPTAQNFREWIDKYPDSGQVESWKSQLARLEGETDAQSNVFDAVFGGGDNGREPPLIPERPASNDDKEPEREPTCTPGVGEIAAGLEFLRTHLESGELDEAESQSLVIRTVLQDMPESDRANTISAIRFTLKSIDSGHVIATALNIPMPLRSGEQETVGDVPSLPGYAQLSLEQLMLASRAGRWLDNYVDYASKVSPMTPKAFHESAALTLASIAIARRLKVPMAYGDVYPNLYFLWLATTTLYRKTTALDVKRGIAYKVFPHLLAAQDTTPEAFLSDLAGREPNRFDQLTEQEQQEWERGRDFSAQKGWVLDEMSGLLASAGRDYNAGLIEALLRFYDCDQRYTRSTRAQGRVTVRNSYLTLLGASTPAAMSYHLLSERLWAMGWWPRFVILTPGSEYPEWREAQDAPEPPELAGALKFLLEALPTPVYPEPPKAQDVLLGDNVMKTWARYNKALGHDLLIGDDLDPRLHGTYGRLPTTAIKVATILAALDWEGGRAVRIEMRHLARAMTMCETWRASVHRALERATLTEYSTLRLRILRQIARHAPNGPTLRELAKAMRDKSPDEIEDALRQMKATDEVVLVEVKPPAQGRAALRWQLVTE